jgi:hypothetical protein
VGRPRQLLTGVVAWQGAARVIRLGALAAFIAAFSLPVTLSTALLVMAVQGVTPTLAATTTPLRAVALAYAFPHAAGGHVDVAHVTEFLLGMQEPRALLGSARASPANRVPRALACRDASDGGGRAARPAADPRLMP